MTSADDSRGLVSRELQLGLVIRVTPALVEMNFTTASAPSGAFVDRQRHGRGEIGEFVLVEGQRRLVLARVVGLRVPESDRHDVGRPGRRDVIGTLQLLGSVNPYTLAPEAGIEAHPRVGDVVFAAPHRFMAEIGGQLGSDDRATLELGSAHGSPVRLPAEALLARHCAVLGATGGGKSWTVARLVEQLAEHTTAKVLLLDATGEYRSLSGPGVTHCHFGAPHRGDAKDPALASFPSTLFEENDFFALFQPSGKIQAPKFREAIKTLRLAKLAGLPTPYPKEKRDRSAFDNEMVNFAEEVECCTTPFDASHLADQVGHECVWPDQGRWGNVEGNALGSCYGLITRIRGIVQSPALAPVFEPASNESAFGSHLDRFLGSTESHILRVDLSDLSYEHNARALIVNAMARMLLTRARTGSGSTRISTLNPLLLVVDEAHQFLGKAIGDEDARYRLDAVELIAREGRKHGLCLCLATQRPRDVTEGVLAQMGCFITHRIVNDHDRHVIERACGEIDREAAAFLPSLRQGHAVIVGVDFPIPLTIQITPPRQRPSSDSATFTARPKPSSTTAAPPPQRPQSTAPAPHPQPVAPPQALAAPNPPRTPRDAT